MRISDWSSDVCSSDLLGQDEHGSAAGVGTGRPAAPRQGALRALEDDDLHRRPALRPDRCALRVRPADQWGELHPVGRAAALPDAGAGRSEEHTSELQSLMRISYAVFCLKQKKNMTKKTP